MASRRPRPRRFVLSTLLAAVLAAEVTGIALAHTLAPVVADPTAAPRAAMVAPAGGIGGAANVIDRGMDRTTDLVAPTIASPRGIDPRITTPPAAAPASSPRAVTAPVRAATSTIKRAATVKVAAASYHGTNHVWIPSLGINKSIQSFPCSRTRPPDAGVYRWGCAGTNNVYLLSHAWSTFEPLHDAYVSGRLKNGMKVVYADGSGHVHTYAVSWWKVVAPTTAASWAWASLSRPSMTLQTCVGANSQYRLMVRLARVA